jgi:hypothetical protein
MKFLCFAYEDEKSLNDLSASEWDALRRDTLAYVETLRANGQLTATHALQSARFSKTIRVRSGKPLVTDGPFTEAKEHVGGYFLVDAPNLDEAVALALGWPSARIGAIEVRPIEEELPTDKRYA